MKSAVLFSRAFQCALLVGIASIALSGCHASKPVEAKRATPAASPKPVVEETAVTEAGAIMAALESGQPQPFRGELNGRVNVSSAPEEAGRPCRSYSVEVFGSRQSGTAVVCKAPDGNWKPSATEGVQED